ncbi:MOSC domain-containing protein [Gulbenkiania mobilis]|uniref:MOSC domain-containing protein n=1 Tax=Gulbenkiania mobilis TaxID=397457 RepID=UPI000B1B03EC|nr:MOSC domain-containing protein [Gulbenkiania mobilis]
MPHRIRRLAGIGGAVMDSLFGQLDTLLVGQPQPFGPNGEVSAIAKHAMAGTLLLEHRGLSGDAQGDRRYHGGPDKAVHHYPAEHYAHWRQTCPQADGAVFRPGGFGENFSTCGLNETTVHFGDIVRAGTALLQVSQARQPCWKLNIRFGQPDMARRVQDSGRTGWYYRVLEPGHLRAGDRLTLVERPFPDWSLARLLVLLYRTPLERAGLDALARLPGLPDTWLELVQRRLETGRVEDWTRRLETPGQQ